MALTIPPACTRPPFSLCFTSPSKSKVPFWSGSCKTASQTPALSSSLSATEVVRKFYDSVNAQDLTPLQELLSDNCIYEDLVYPQPFVGRQAIVDFLQHYVDSITPDFKFVIDDITDGDHTAVGVVWHVEWKQKRFPFARGCSFYRCEYVQGNCKIRYGRDCVESAIKPGGANLVILKALVGLFSAFPWLLT